MAFVAQIIGGIAIAFWVISIQNKDRKDILFCQMIANLLYTFQYALLGAMDAAVMNLTSTIRCFTFYLDEKKNRESSLILLFVFIFIILGSLFFTYNGLMSFIPIVITLLYTYFSYKKGTLGSRIVFLVCAFVWTIYNYKVGAYISIVGNIFEIISGSISLIRFRKEK